MKKLTLLLVVITMVAASCNQSALAQDRVLQIKSKKITVQVADTPAKRAQGLGGVNAITDEEGMYFLFSEPQSLVFWMKGMKFPIDIIWINGNKIVGITDNVKVESGKDDTQLTKYGSPAPADKVLEVNAGWAYRRDVNVGDTVIEVSK